MDLDLQDDSFQSSPPPPPLDGHPQSHRAPSDGITERPQPFDDYLYFEIFQNDPLADDKSRRKHLTSMGQQLRFTVLRSTIQALPLASRDRRAPLELMIAARFQHGESNDHFFLEEASETSFQLFNEIFCTGSIDGLPEFYLMLRMNLEDVYYFALFMSKYNIDHHDCRVKKWFREWYDEMVINTQRVDILERLLFPCWFFDHAEAFLAITRDIPFSALSRIENITP